jgi:hypothetical protein
MRLSSQIDFPDLSPVSDGLLGSENLCCHGALVYSTAEYCGPVWLISLHTTKIDIQLNNTMRLISETVKSTQLQWLPMLVNIAPPKLRREATTVRELVNCRRHARSLLYEQMLDIPDQRFTFP